MSSLYSSSPLYTSSQTPSAPTIYSAFANKNFYPQYKVVWDTLSPDSQLTSVVNHIKYSSPALRSMILVAPSTTVGWSVVSGYNAILIGLSLAQVQKFRISSNWSSPPVQALKARLAVGGKSGVLSQDSYILNFNYVTWIP